MVGGVAHLDAATDVVVLSNAEAELVTELDGLTEGDCDNELDCALDGDPDGELDGDPDGPVRGNPDWLVTGLIDVNDGCGSEFDVGHNPAAKINPAATLRTM